jgi:NAD(P)-dependent dehydrogenase (short-subunit alcohol dehydrogenase family)
VTKKAAELFDMTGQTALITGGGTGLGRGFADTLAAAGARIIIGARSREKTRGAVECIQDTGAEAHFVEMDVSDAGSVTRGFAEAAEIAPVDVLVNNAGIVVEPLLHELAEEQWDSVMDVNLKGCWLVAREAVKRMIADGRGGAIVNISSVMGTCVMKGTGAYAASKAGLIHLTHAMSLEWIRYGIRVNALAPGYCHTEISEDFFRKEAGQKIVKRIPQRRLGTTDDMAGAILLLCSSASGYMTGSVVTVDGGITLSVV